MRVAQKRLEQLLGQLLDWSRAPEREPMDHVVMNAHLNEMLNDLSDNDHFGTEGQNDPRGDQRG